MVVGRRHGSVVKGLEILVVGRRRLGWLLLTGGLRITSSVSIVLQLAWHGVTVTRTVIQAFFLDISKITQGQKNSGRKKLKQIFQKTQANNSKTQYFAN